MRFTFAAELWVWDARREGGWTFVSLPADAAAEICDLADAAPRRAFGSVRVRATIGGSVWSTSVFPDSARGTYSVPVKKSVRTAESLAAGDTVTVTVEVIDA